MSIVAIPFFLFFLVFLVVLFLPFLALVIILIALRRGNRFDRVSEQDARVLQEMYSGLQRMEERVETLETILIDQLKKS